MMHKIKKLLAFMLIAALTVTPLPVMALAEDVAETELPSLQSMPADPATSLGMKALEKLAGGVLSGIAGKGVNEAFAAIFGSDTAQILKALNEIKGKLDNIEAQIKGLSGKLDEKELRGNLDSFAEFFSHYATPYNLLCDYQADLAYDAELTDVFMQDLYRGTDRNIDTDGKTVIAAANALGNRITTVLTGGYNVFGAFDKLERYQNRWEHQGYDMRKEYRNYIINVYTLFNAMGQVACEKMIEAYQGDSLSDKNIRMQAQRHLNELRDNAEKVKNMNQRCTVAEHPNLRIYRDTTSGTDLYALYGYLSKSYVQNWTEGTDLDGMLSDDFMHTITHTVPAWKPYLSGGTRIISNQFFAEDFARIYADYKSDNDGRDISLFHIFFDEDKGNFENYTSLQEGTRFITNSYLCFKPLSQRNEHWLSTKVVDNDMKLETVTLAYLIGHRLTLIPDETFFSVSKYSGYLHQGALQSPNWLPTSETAGMISGMDSSYELPYSDSITLSMEEKAGATYQWFVAEGDGNDFEEIADVTAATYTLPALEPSMNGWMYRCAVIENEGTEEEVCTLADPVTLNLTGEGVPEPVTEHEVGDAVKLKEALDKVLDGSWDNHTLKLTDDITYPHPVTLIGSRDVTIDLNRYTLTVQPSSTAEPNLNPMSDKPEVAGVYVHFGSLNLTGTGQLNVVAANGVAYGVYAGEGGSCGSFGEYGDPSYDFDANVTSTGGGTAVYAADGGSVGLYGSVSAEGDNAYAIECFDGSNVRIDGTITADGDSSCGVYLASYNGNPSYAGGWADIEVSGESSRGAYVNGKGTWLSFEGDITVTGNGAFGLTAGGGVPGDYTTECIAYIGGDITAPFDAVNAYDGALVQVSGNVTVTDEKTTAVSAKGGIVDIYGDVASTGGGGTGINASAWDLDDPALGAEVTINGNITAHTPIWIESLPVEESEHTGEPDEDGYYTFTDGTSTVRAKPGALIFTDTVTFDKNGGNTEARPATKEVIPGGSVDTLPTAPTRSGYTFVGWNTQANGSGTAFTEATAVSGSITVYAQWSRKSSGDGGTSTPVETPQPGTNVSGNTATATTTVTAAVDSSGNAAATVSRTQVSDAISKAMEEAGKQGEGTAARVEIKVQAPADATTTETSIPKEAVSQASEAGIGALTISTPVASITFDANTLSALSEEATDDVKITASKVEASSLLPEAQRIVGDRPVFDFRVTSGDKTISQFGGDVSVSVPYTPKEGEDTNAIIIYYINASGELEVVSNCSYDSATGRVSFSTRHFSQYAVGYNKVIFKDVAEGAWYSKAVGFIAAREVTTGTGGGNFSPEAKLTRGQFIVLLMKAYGIAPDESPRDNFSDAGNTWYTGYLSATKRIGISAGVGSNLFAPEKEITRQEMFTLMYNALKAIDELPESDSDKTLFDFADAGQVDSWAKDAMKLLVETGTIAGNAARLNPRNTTTRAEMVQLLYNLLSE